MAAVYAAIALLLYSGTYGAGFVTDFLGWLSCPQETSFWNLHTCFGNRALFIIPFALLQFLYGIFGTHPLAWFVFFVGMHVVNGLLVARLCRSLAKLANTSLAMWVPAVAGLIFLVHPYQTEVVAWKACVNYLSSTALMLGVLVLYSAYLRNRSHKSLVWSIFCYGLMLFTLEFSLMVPLLLAGMYTLIPGMSIRDKLKDLVRSIWPYLGLIVVLLLVNTIALDTPVGHYEIDPAKLHPLSLVSTELMYLVKILGFSRFTSYPLQTQIYDLLDQIWIAALALTFLLGLIVLLWMKWQSLSPKTRITWYGIASMLILILPVAHLYFYYLQYSENDRYTYLAMVFAGIWLSIWLSRSVAGRIVLILYVAVSIGLTFKMVNLWKQSHRVHEHLLETFRWGDQSEVYLLNVPDNLQGVFMFRNIGADSAFEEALTLLKNRSVDAKIYDVMQYNMATPSDGVSIERSGEDSLRVTFDQWGNWWWRNGIGGTAYENDKYRVTPEGQWYTVEFFNIADDAAIVWFDGEEWQEVVSR